MKYDKQQSYQNMYSRNGSQGTIVPEMHKAAPNVESVQQPEATSPVVGFLYSVSRNGVGEYWPVQIGRNSIGRDPDCDVCLQEGTVSNMHALLNVKFLNSTGKLVAQIRDEGSKTGLTVNGDELDFGVYDLKDGDLITIGKNYTLLLLLINAAEKGLSIAQDFIPTDDEPVSPTPNWNADATDSPYNPANKAKGGTQAIDGDDEFLAGKTRFL